jgi:hypothetical protein
MSNNSRKRENKEKESLIVSYEKNERQEDISSDVFDRVP